MCSYIALLSTVDSSIGRIDYEMLTDQQAMEIFIAEIDEKFQKKLQGGDGNYFPVLQWKDIAEIDLTCDSNEHVVEMHAFALKGTVSLDALPRKLQKCTVVGQGKNRVEGTVDTATLPKELIVLKITRNRLRGTFDMRKLPSSLEMLSIDANKFTGSCDLSSLPTTLKHLKANSNDFSGSLTLDTLPLGLAYLNLSNNQLSGEICLQNFPPALAIIILSENQLCGEFRMTDVPSALHQFDASYNEFTGVAVVSREVDYEGLCLVGNAISCVLDANGENNENVII